ncbi:MAG: peptidoglycan DD-metalloendopeptidase family protein [Candidatus Uhrbacteria bacterium]|nr:peptidoglycan DD-metalloendopeptidase family protein [Candidatus Uhrbacteria bacterium]
MEERFTRALAVVALIVGIAMSDDRLVFAQSEKDLGDIQTKIDDRQAEIARINSKLDEYRKKITQYSRESASLSNDLALLENESAMAELDVASTQNEIDTENLELSIIEQRMGDATDEIAKQQQILSSLLFELYKQDNKGLLDMVFGAETFNDVFSSAAQLESVNDRMGASLTTTKSLRDDLQDQQNDHEQRVVELAVLEDELGAKITQLDMKRGAKEVLVSQTQDSETEYRVLMSELRQEQQFITSQIAALQNDYSEKLNDTDEYGDVTVITWPLQGIITALFHDTTYPFRHLFEHSGLDIAVPQGTAIGAAAPGYVAWARTGNMYGNYVMVVHANGLATLYAHMSRIDVVPDQFVARGDIIGLSGGRPGTQGAGFSTGSHLHFEVRKDGIPDNPFNYLVD